MHRLLLFNPSNDMALAANSQEYLPPLHIQRMESDLAFLPLWWAEEDDYILMPDNSVRHVDLSTIQSLHDYCSSDSHDVEFLQSIFSSMPIVKDVREVCSGLIPAPWGWNNALRRRLLRLGVSPISMPTEAILDDYRQLSSRAFACEYIRELFREADSVGLGDRLVGRGMKMISDISELSESVPSIHTNPSHTDPSHTDPSHVDSSLFTLHSSLIFKTPWSSSGRGVWVSRSSDSIDIKRIQRTIRQQGQILVDDFYEDKIIDFALEFEVTGPATYVKEPGFQNNEKPEVHFLGYSVFCASDNGNYGYNVVASQAELRERILSSGIDAHILDWVIDYSINSLSHHLCSRYRGYVGIDMLICHHNNKIKLHPCVEINLRRNMGILALDILYKMLVGLTQSDFLLVGQKHNGFSVAI
ncbi:MAG: hypothetical protein K6E54_09195, partial [Bacteroidaceae bacterium]|nr:hypothetical protein [Bacteroidaceae bacterium]